MICLNTSKKKLINLGIFPAKTFAQTSLLQLVYLIRNGNFIFINHTLIVNCQCFIIILTISSINLQYPFFIILIVNFIDFNHRIISCYLFNFWLFPFIIFFWWVFHVSFFFIYFLLLLHCLIFFYLLLEYIFKYFLFRISL